MHNKFKTQIQTLGIRLMIFIIIITIGYLCSGCTIKDVEPDNKITETTEIEEPRGTDLSQNSYHMDVVLNIPETGGDNPAKLYETLQVTINNDSEDAWEELCFRDLMQPVQQEANNRSEKKIDYISKITSAKSDGTELQIRTDKDDVTCIFIALESPLEPGESTIVELEYETEVPVGGFRCAWLPYYSERSDMVAYSCELAQFYPMLAKYENGKWACDKYIFEGECMYTRCFDYDIDIQVPHGATVVASGQENTVYSSEEGDTWHINAKNMRDMTIAVSNQYDLVSDEICGVTINSYFYSTEQEDSLSHSKQGEISLQAAKDAVEAYTEAYGAYPYEELDVVESNYEYGGMEAPGLVRISNLYSWFFGQDNTQEEKDEYTSKLQVSVAHEIAHQWFYGVVGNDQYNEAWLDESLASFSESAVYWRHVGKCEADIVTAIHQFDDEMSEDNMCIDKSYTQLSLESDYVNAVYKRGAVFLYELEQSMGQNNFYTFMKEYYKTYSFKEVHTADFSDMLASYIRDNDEAQGLVNLYLSLSN